MLAKYQRVFLLYYSQYTWDEIAKMMEMTVAGVRAIINRHGDEWVRDYLKLEYKQRILELVQEGKNSEQIAKDLGWNRWLVTWTVKRLQIAELLKPTRTLIPATRYLAFRCSRCNAQFSARLDELVGNPDRLCSECVDRRKGDRRSSTRDEPNADDVA